MKISESSYLSLGLTIVLLSAAISVSVKLYAHGEAIEDLKTKASVAMKTCLNQKIMAVKLGLGNEGFYDCYEGDKK